MGVNIKKQWSPFGKMLSLTEPSEVSFFVGGDVLIKGCGDILSYSEEEIAVMAHDRRLTVCGKGLTMRSYYRSDIWIGGDIAEMRVES